MKIYLYRYLLASILFVGMISCKNDAPKSQMPTLTIPIVKVVKQDVPVYGDFVGQTYGRKDIPIRARVDGFLEGIYFDEGTRVKKGQLLYRIEPQSLTADVAAAESKVREAETNLVKARNDLNRVKPLAEIDAVSKSELDDAEAKFRAAEAQLNSAKANKKVTDISLSYSEVRSPIDGVIGITSAKVGEYVGKDPNPVILNTVSEIDSIIVRFFIIENIYLELARVYKQALRESAKGRRANPENSLGMELILNDGKSFAHRGFVYSVDNKVDPETGTVLAQALFPNPDNILRPGLFARLRAIMDTKEDALIVPQRAVQFVQGKPNVLVVDNENKVEFRAVAMGVKYLNMWEVVSGLKDGDKIVLEGAQKLRTGMIIEPKLIDFEIVGE